MQIHIHSRRSAANPAVEEYAHRRLNFALSRFQTKIRQVVMNLEDVNGPRGGVDQECRIAIRLQWGAQVTVSEREASLHAAIARAAERAGRAVSRQVDLHGTPAIRHRDKQENLQ